MCVVCDRYFWVVCVVFLCRMSLAVCVVIVAVCVWWVVVNVVGCSHCPINITLQVLCLVVVADICHFGSFYNDPCNLPLWIGIPLWQKEIKIIELLYDGSDEGPGGVTRGWSCYMSGGRGSCSVTDSTLTMIRLLYVLHQQECTGNAGKTTHMYKGVRVHSTGCTQLKKYKHTPAKSEGSTQCTKCKEIILLTVSVSCKG